MVGAAKLSRVRRVGRDRGDQAAPRRSAAAKKSRARAISATTAASDPGTSDPSVPRKTRKAPEQASGSNRRSGAGRRGGRPAGSVELTPEIQNTIVNYVLSGATDHQAAQAVRISPRTFRDWMARGEGRHPTRRKTPQLEGFAEAVNQADAQARVAKEIEVFRTDPKWWLAHRARSKPGREGWTEPVPEWPADPLEPRSGEPEPLAQELAAAPERAARIIDILIASGAVRCPSCEGVMQRPHEDPGTTPDTHQRKERFG